MSILRSIDWKNKTSIFVHFFILIFIIVHQVISDSTDLSNEGLKLTEDHNHHSPRTSKSIVDKQHLRDHHHNPHHHQPSNHHHQPSNNNNNSHHHHLSNNNYNNHHHLSNNNNNKHHQPSPDHHRRRRHHNKHANHSTPLPHHPPTPLPHHPPTQHGGDDEVKSGCHGDEERKLLKHCYTLLRTVMVKYSKLLKEEENDTKVLGFDVCGNLDKVFSSCSAILTDDVTRQCLSRDKKLETFTVIVEHFAGVCKNAGNAKQRQSSLEMDSCFREEYRGTLSIRCDEYFEFNKHQATMDDCHFHRERFRCLESLLESSCGTSTFNFNFLLIVYERQLVKSNCSVVRQDPNYAVFGYDQKGCKRGLIKRLEWCTSTHLDGSFILQFHPENDLVALGNPKNIYKLCRAYVRFTKCIQPIRDTCPKAVSLFLQYESKLYQYILKMDFICSEQVLEAYSSNLKCLRSAITEHHMDKCESHWTHLRPFLHQLSSVDFYCIPQKQTVVEMTNELSSLHSCHKNVLTDQCGSISGNMIVKFLQLALTDPLYLRFGYRPNCSLHGFETHQRQEEDDFDNLSVVSREHPHLNHPSYDDDDVIATSGIAEDDSDHMITKSSWPSSPFGHHVTPSPEAVGAGGIIDHSNDYLEKSTEEGMSTEVADEIYFPRDKIIPSSNPSSNSFYIPSANNNGDRSIRVQYLIMLAVSFSFSEYLIPAIILW